MTPQPDSVSVMPAPFDWVPIPAAADEPSYSIGKYPVTNAQFARFIEAGGYGERRWWTDAGWQVREEGWLRDQDDKKTWKPSGTPWTEPRFWQEDPWNVADHPVVGISWYEAAAFCLWLSDVTGEAITLPTRAQWQYAAQSDDGRTYPWGEEWDATRCNNSVEPCVSSGTTPVTQYAGKGDSPFGVVDMKGNTWEWCLNDYHNQLNGLHDAAKWRVLCGASWGGSFPGSFRCTDAFFNLAVSWSNDSGFRLVRTE